jgi:hypothetical protein
VPLAQIVQEAGGGELGELNLVGRAEQAGEHHAIDADIADVRKRVIVVLERRK